jgi:hypothetical protein
MLISIQNLRQNKLQYVKNSYHTSSTIYFIDYKDYFSMLNLRLKSLLTIDQYLRTYKTVIGKKWSKVMKLHNKIIFILRIFACQRESDIL